eukprot:2991488-Prymnesium_polylepis.1
MAKDEELDEDALAPRAVVAKPIPAAVQEATLEEALSGKFARLQVVKDAPSWLEAALAPGSDTAKDLHGQLIVYRWQDYGFCVARLGTTSDETANFSGLREDHTLTISSYNTGEYGGWCLLESTRPATPLLDYKNGKYLKSNQWHRNTADALLHHTGDELAAARDQAAAAKIEASQAACEEELADDGHEVGDKVYVRAIGPEGEA